MKTIQLLAIVISIVFLLSACGRINSQPDTLTTVKVTIANNMSYAPILIAEQQGYFEDYGIQIEHVIFDKASEAVALLSTGKIDVYAGTLNTGLINAIYEGKNIKAVADRGHIAPDACTYQAILIRKDLHENGTVKNPEDLAGYSFSASTAGPAAYLLSSYLTLGGLTFDDIEIVDLPTQAEIDGFANKAIEGSVAPEPDLSRLVASGHVEILAGAEDVLGTFQSGVIAFGDELLINNPDAGVRFLAAYLQGVRKYNEGKTDTNLQTLSTAFDETAENLKSICWVSINADGKIDFSSIEKFAQWSIDQGQLSQPVTEEMFWDPSILEKAMKLMNDE